MHSAGKYNKFICTFIRRMISYLISKQIGSKVNSGLKIKTYLNHKL